MKSRLGAVVVSMVIGLAMAAAAQFAAPGRALAADADLKIGVVDLRAVAEKHPGYVAWQQDFMKTKAEREQAIEKTIKEKYNLPDDPQKAAAALTDDQKREIQGIMADENQKFQEEMQDNRDRKMQEVQEDILAAVKVVAADKGINMVVDSAVVLFGGNDITMDVIEQIKKTVPAPAPDAGAPK